MKALGHYGTLGSRLGETSVCLYHLVPKQLSEELLLMIEPQPMPLQFMFTTSTPRLMVPRVTFSPHFGPEQCSFSLTQSYWSPSGIVCSRVCVNCTGCMIALLQLFGFLFQSRRYELPFVSYFLCLGVIINSKHIRSFVGLQLPIATQNNNRSTRARSTNAKMILLD